MQLFSKFQDISITLSELKVPVVIGQIYQSSVILTYTTKKVQHRNQTSLKSSSGGRKNTNTENAQKHRHTQIDGESAP